MNSLPFRLSAILALALFGCSVIVDGTIEPAVDAGPDCRGITDWQDCPGLEGERDWVCLGGQCVESRCGDHLVDPRFEECDPETPEPGCQNCRWACTSNQDCNDGDLCNGTESCNLATHLCAVSGIPSPGTPCETPDGVPGTCQQEGVVRFCQPNDL